MYKISKLSTTQQAKLLKKTLIINFIYLECMNRGGAGSYTKNFLFIPWQDTRVTTE